MNPVDPSGVQPVGQAAPEAVQPRAASGFKELVDAKAEGITFSRHAAQRMQERQIQLSANDLSLLNQAMGQARSAGASKAAVVMDPGIFIVAPGSNTVITTVPKNSAQPMQVVSHVDALVLVGGTSSEGASSPRVTDGGQPAIHWSLMQNPDS